MSNYLYSFPCTLLFIGIALNATSLISRCDQSAHVSQEKEIATPLLLDYATKPADLVDLRLHELEQQLGIQRYIWGIVIPTKTDLVLHISGGDSVQKPPTIQDLTYKITGPLKASFDNRFSLVRHISPLPNYAPGNVEEIILVINTKTNQLLTTVGSVIIPVTPDWGSRWGVGFSPNPIPGIVYSEQQGPKAQPQQITYKLEVSTSPADANSKPGDIQSSH